MSTSERVTVTLPAELVEGIDRLERNRSRFIAEAVEHELARRRREALLSSVSNPHPETADLADAGLGEWTADLPDDEGLVDPTVGHEQRGVRPCIAVSDPSVNADQRFPLIAVVPVTGTSGVGALYPVLSAGTSGLTKTSYALVDHLRSIDKRRIRRIFGQLPSRGTRGHRPGAATVSGPRCSAIAQCSRAAIRFSKRRNSSSNRRL